MQYDTAVAYIKLVHFPFLTWQHLDACTLLVLIGHRKRRAEQHTPARDVTL